MISTSLYFIVFGAAIGSRMAQIDGISYGAYIVPGLIMLAIYAIPIAMLNTAVAPREVLLALPGATPERARASPMASAVSRHNDSMSASL